MWFVSLIVVLLILPIEAAANEPDDIANANDLFIVDCLLPGQIRQLGLRTTYVSARRPVKTTALDCRVRGGEYVVADRASYKTALGVWLQQAKTNDPQAQTTVGEIFERGMGAEPDYQAAAHWYQLAAEQEFTRAQINLGYLYERGLGVTKNPQTAIAWYRRAAGLNAMVNLEPTADVAPIGAMREQELAALRTRVERLESDAEKLRKSLFDSRALLAGQEKAHIKFEREVSRERDLVVVAGQEEKLTYSQKISSLNQIVKRSRRQVMNLSIELTDVRRSLVAASTELEGSEQLAESRKRELEQALAQLLSRESEVADRQQEVKHLGQELNRLLAETQREVAPQVAPVLLNQRILAGPVIALIDPVIPKARGLVKVSVPTSLSTRRIVGRVTAPAGLLALSVNEIPVQANAAGVFSTQVKLLEGVTGVDISVIDSQGKKAELNFELSSRASVSATVRPDKPTHKQVDFGKYYALIIGNSQYQNLPRLDTPLNDVQRLDRVLRLQYGFKTQLVVDATRYQILSALNELRAKLTTKDNLLIYYAGHGVMDKVNMRGHWLPVDAEPNNTANWISNISITDILNVIAAKQILLIVDSCYSGTLTRSAIAQQRTQLTDVEMVSWLKIMADKRARVVLTSGGLAPVLDSGGGRHSLFAKSLFEVLEANQGVLEGRSLYQGVAARVAYAAANLAFEQTPQYAPIGRAGHEAGDFFLLPQ